MLREPISFHTHFKLSKIDIDASIHTNKLLIYRRIVQRKYNALCIISVTRCVAGNDCSLPQISITCDCNRCHVHKNPSIMCQRKVIVSILLGENVLQHRAFFFEIRESTFNQYIADGVLSFFQKEKNVMTKCFNISAIS